MTPHADEAQPVTEDYYLVTVKFKIGAGWSETDSRLVAAAGRRADRSGVEKGVRELQWTVDGLIVAMAMKNLLDRLKLAGVSVTVRER